MDSMLGTSLAVFDYPYLSIVYHHKFKTHFLIPQDRIWPDMDLILNHFDRSEPGYLPFDKSGDWFYQTCEALGFCLAGTMVSLGEVAAWIRSLNVNVMCNH